MWMTADCSPPPTGKGGVRLWGMSMLTDPYQVLCADFGGVSQSVWNQYASGNPLPKVCS